jgi:hypothetical protein
MNYRLAYTTASGIPTNLYTDIASTTVDNTSLYSIKYLPNSNQAQLVRNFTSNNPSVITQREGMTARAYFEGSMLFQPKYDGTLGNYIVGGLLKAYGVYNAFTDQTDYFYFPSSSTGYNIIEIGAVTDYYNLRGVLQPRFYVVTNNNKNPSALDIAEVFVNAGGTFVSSIYTANASNLTIDITASALSDTYFYGTRINGGFGLNWGDGYVVESSTGKTLEIPFREQTTGLFYQLRYSFATGTATVFGINNETSFAAVANRGIRRISNHNYISPDSTESKVSNAASGFIDITTHNYYIDNVQQVTIPIALNDSSIYWSIDGRRVFYDYQTNDYILTVKTDQLEDLSNINSTS